MKNKYILHFKNLLYDKQFIKYTLIGLVGVSIDFILFTLLVELTPVNFLIANFIAITIAIINNFLLNTFFNFKKKNKLFKRFLFFYSVGFLGIVLSQIILFTFTTIGFSEMVSKLLTLPPVLIFQFILNKKITFSDDFTTLLIYIKRYYRLAIYLLFLFFILYLGYSIASKNIYFSDEFDNILGASLLLKGYLPYLDFFSHHGPLTYYVGAPIYYLSGDNLVLFRNILYIFLSTWALFNALLVSKYYSKLSSLVFFISYILIIMPLWGGSLLAESLILPAIITCFILVLNYYPVSKLHRNLVITSLSFFGIWVFANNPIYSPIVYLLLAYYIYNNKRFLKMPYDLLFQIFITIFPYIVIVSFMLISNTMQPFYRDYIVFNKEYYSIFTTNILSLANMKSIFVNSFWEISAQFSTIATIFNLNGIILIGWLGGLLYFLLNKKYLFSILLLIFWFVSQLRLIGLSVDPEIPNHHAIIWRGIGLFLFSAILIGLFRLQGFAKNKTLYSTFFAFIVLASIILVSYSFNNAGTIMKSKPVNTQLSNEAQLFRNLNKQASTKETTWAGPLNFEYYIGSKAHSSRYYFFLPWHAKCESCKQELLKDLTENSVEIIYWNDDGEIWNRKTSEWGIFMNDFLVQNKYLVSKDKKLKNYYFINESVKNKAEGVASGKK